MRHLSYTSGDDLCCCSSALGSSFISATPLVNDAIACTANGWGVLRLGGALGCCGSKCVSPIMHDEIVFLLLLSSSLCCCALLISIVIRVVYHINKQHSRGELEFKLIIITTNVCILHKYSSNVRGFSALVGGESILSSILQLGGFGWQLK